MKKIIQSQGRNLTLEVRLFAEAERSPNGKQWHIVECQNMQGDVLHRVKVEKNENLKSSVERFQKECEGLFDDSVQYPAEFSILHDLGFSQ